MKIMLSAILKTAASISPFALHIANVGGLLEYTVTPGMGFCVVLSTTVMVCAYNAHEHIMPDMSSVIFFTQRIYKKFNKQDKPIPTTS